VGVNGGNSSAFGLTAIGGAGGGSRDFTGRSGGSAGEIADGGRGGDGIVIIKYKRDYAYSNPSNSITTKNLFFNLDCARTGSFTGPRKDHDFWYDLQQGIRGTINGDIQLEAPDSNQAAPQFDGNNKYVTFDLGQSIQVWGLEMWARFDDAVPNNDTAIGGPTTYQTMWTAPAGGTSFRVNLGAWTGSATNEAVHIWNGSTMTYNRDYLNVGWHHLFFKWNGSTYDIFIDGFKTRTYARSSSGHCDLIEGMSSLDVGGSIANTYMFQGKIPVFRIYNGEISDEEVYKNFNALRWRYDV